jgi:Galactose oxidase, central domain
VQYAAGADMLEARGDHACWSDGTAFAYCMGGFTIEVPNTPLASTERFDVAANKWESRADMIDGRGDFVLVSVCHAMRCLRVEAGMEGSSV